MRVIAAIAVSTAVLGSAAACGQAETEHSGRGTAAPAHMTEPQASPQAQSAGGNLLNAAELELVSKHYASLAPGETKEITAAFDGVPVGSLIVFTNKPRSVSVTFGGLPFQTGDLFGVPTLFINLRAPADGVIVFENRGSERAAVSLDVRAATSRKIEVEVGPRAVAPNQPVTITATVTEPHPADLVRLQVIRDRRAVAELRPREIRSGTWRATFVTSKPGFYVVASRVDGGPPRVGSDTLGFTVADPGTRIIGFDDRLIDADGNGSAEALAVRFELEIAKPGDYMLTVLLGDKHGRPLRAGAGGDPYRHLESGRQYFELRWLAESIQSVGVPGPWHLVSVELVRVKPDFQTQAAIDDLGPTRAYPLQAFEHRPSD
jgi:hypothetical protein